MPEKKVASSTATAPAKTAGKKAPSAAGPSAKKTSASGAATSASTTSSTPPTSKGAPAPLTAATTTTSTVGMKNGHVALSPTENKDGSGSGSVNVDMSSPEDTNKVVKIQSVWRGKKQRETFSVKREERVRAREERYAYADLFDAAFVIQRLVRRIRAKRAAKAEIQRRVDAGDLIMKDGVAYHVTKGGKGKQLTAGEMEDIQAAGNAAVAAEKAKAAAAAAAAANATTGSSSSAVTNSNTNNTKKGTPSSSQPPNTAPSKVVAKKTATPTTTAEDSSSGSLLPSTVTSKKAAPVAKRGASKSAVGSATAVDSSASTPTPTPGRRTTDGSGSSLVPNRGAAGSALALLRGSPRRNDNDLQSDAKYNVVLSQVPDRLLRFSHPPQDDELLRLFQSIESIVARTEEEGTLATAATLTCSMADAANNQQIDTSNQSTPSTHRAGVRGGSSGALVVGHAAEVITEAACREVFCRFGGEVLLLKGETVESAVRTMLERIVRPTAPAMASNKDEEIVVNFDQFCRFMLKVVPQ